MTRPKSVPTLIFASLASVACLGAMIAGSAQASSPIGTYTTKGAWRFFSAPKLHPPILHADKASKGLAPGYFMVANFPDLGATQPSHGKAKKMVGQSGPLILNQRLQPVWFNPVPKNVVAANLKPQSFAGKPALSWWQGVLTTAGQVRSGEDVVVNQNYKTVAKLKGQDGWVITLHDIAIKGNDAWVTVNKNVTMDLKPAGGSGVGTMVDVGVQKFDLTTGKAVSTWDAMQHIPLTDSFQPPVGNLWDPYHINSIQIGNGTMLVSLRNTWAAYQVMTSSGLIKWTLGGKHSTFKIAKSAQFHWQHDVEYHRGGVVSVFDDNCCQQTGPGKFAKANGTGRGLVLKLDTAHNTASFVSQYISKPPLTPNFLGNTDLLPHGNVAVGWGSLPFFSEFNKSGKMLFDAFWPSPDLSYRTVVARWTGKPFFPPSGTARTSGSKTTVYASWDGSTQVTAWRVLGGSSASHLSTVVKKKSKGGFETAIPLSHSYKAYKVQALDSKGHVLRTSNVFPKPHGSSSTGGFY